MRERGKPDDQLGGGGGFARSKPAQLETMTAQEGPVQEMTSETYSLTGS